MPKVSLEVFKYLALELEKDAQRHHDALVPSPQFSQSSFRMGTSVDVSWSRDCQIFCNRASNPI